MNKNFILITCILAIIALAAAVVIFMPTRPGIGANGYGLHTDNEGETYVPYMINAPKLISPSRAWEIMQANPYAVILDVRTQQEFDNERIPGAVLLPDYAVAELAAEVLPDKNAVILVYCRAGVRSQRASNALAEMGYTNVYDFGGINSWPYERE